MTLARYGAGSPRMIVIGLTGSIGMGKTAAAAALRRMGIPVFEADRVVHALLGPGGAAVTEVAMAFPEAARAGRIDRRRLGERVFRDPDARRELEAIVHPLVRAEERRFVVQAARRREPVVVLDLPLLFETGADRRCDATILVTAPSFVQRARVLARPGMTFARFAAIRALQMPDEEKRRRADYIVPTGLGRRAALNRLRTVIRLIKEKHRVRRGLPAWSWRRKRP